MGFARFRVQLKSGFKFAFRAPLIVLPQVKHSKGQMISGKVLGFFTEALFTEALNEFSGVFNLVRRSRSVSQQQKCLFVARLSLQDLDGGIARLLKIAASKQAHAKFELDLRI